MPTAISRPHDGRAKLVCADWEPFPEQPSEEFPLDPQHRAHRGALAHPHQDARGADSGASVAARLARDESARCQKLGLRSHDSVDVVSRRGEVRKVELRLTEIIAPGQVFMPFHFSETNVNEITQSAFDPISREPNYKQCAVRVERAAVKR